MKITQYIKVITDNLVLNEDNLNKLDASIGDGDHGSNIVRGFQAILSQVSNFTNESLIEKDLMICAQQLMSKVGGSSGPILGTAFMALATVLKGKTKIVNEDLANALETAYTRMCQLGKSKIGEKTMLDALYPTIAALKTTPEILDFTKAAVAAKDGAEATIKMLATKGRASYLGERSIGHMDPGACSVAIIFSALAKINQMTPEENKNDSLKSEVHNQNETNKYSLLPITKNVSILMISHSLALAKAM
jgi:dihydroxyacetone kinase-like protein